MKELARSENGIIFYRLENPADIDKFRIGEYVYFKKHLGMSDYVANFKSWLRRKNILLIVAVFKGTIIGWVMNERWNDCSKDVGPVSVLRGIEVHPNIKRKGIGKVLFLLSSMILVGYIITKPVNESAKRFFSSLRFSSTQDDSPIELSNHPGYMALHVGKENSIRPVDGITVFTKNISQCTNELFMDEIAEIKKREAIRKRNISSTNNNAFEGENLRYGYACSEKSSGAEEVKKTVISGQNTGGKYLGVQKMKSPCQCGTLYAKKYLIKGGRKGISIICSNCKKERYFLPQKNQ